MWVASNSSNVRRKIGPYIVPRLDKPNEDEEEIRPGVGRFRLDQR
jgi:hypothetical protein